MCTDDFVVYVTRNENMPEARSTKQLKVSIACLDGEEPLMQYQQNVYLRYEGIENNELNSDKCQGW